MTDGAQIEYYIWDRKLKMTHVAQVLGISTSTLKNKLTGKTDFKVSEADKLSHLLELTREQRDACFFAPEVYWTTKLPRRQRTGTERSSS